MDAKAIRTFITEHPGGVEIRFIDGTSVRVPHRDYIWFTPAYGEPESKVGRLATSFWLHDPDRDQTRLVNALLVRDIVPLPRNGRRARGGRRRSRRR